MTVSERLRAAEEEAGTATVVELSVIVPVFNEHLAVSQTIETLRQVVDHLGISSEIIVVDDGSTDGTADELAAISSVRVKTHPYNIGNGAAIKSGIRMSRGRYILMLDADGQHDPADIIQLVDVRDRYDMVVAERSRGSETELHRDVANRVFNVFASWVCNQKIRDLTSGFRLVRADVARTLIDLLPNTFSYPTTLTLAVLRSGYSVAYVPIVVHRRVGRSKVRLFADGVRFFSILLRIAVFFAPLKVFTPLSLIFFVTGFGWYLYRVFDEHRPFPPISILLMLSALFIFLIGLLSEQITYLRHERR